jgi:hypothetical protein
MKVFLSVVLVASVLVSGMGIAAEDKVIPAVFTDVAPVIDGDDSDAAWASAARRTDFHQVRPIEFDPAGEDLEIRVLYDQNFLYVYAVVTMHDIAEITANKLAQGSITFAEDQVYLVLDPYRNRRTGYQFMVTPNGVREEGLYDGARRLNRNWDGVWQANTRRTPTGWAAEIAIPFKSINFDASNEDWGISFGLKIFGRDEEIAWTSHGGETGPASAGTLSGVKRAEQGYGLDITPSLSVQRDKNYETGKDDYKVEPSIDALYKITPSLTAAVTVNTDFSAAEVDDRVVSVDRFSVFFPEKRDFFLQDADIFSFADLSRNGIPFFSRRIGLDEDGAPIDVRGGAKLTGRIGPVNLGLLDVLQDDTGGGGTTNLVVARASMNVLKESSIGALVTHGTPIAGENNTLVGVDANYQSRDLLEGKTLRSSWWYQRSKTSDISGSEYAFGASVAIPRSAGWYGHIVTKQIGSNFNPGLGFVNRSGIREYYGEVHFRKYVRDSWLQFWDPHAQFLRVENLDGDTESQSIDLEPLFIGTNTTDWFRAGMSFKREVLFEPFEISDGVIIPAGDYRWERYRATIDSGEHRAVYVDLTVEVGTFYAGRRTNLQPKITWQPSPHFSTEVGYSQWNVSLPEGRFTTRLLSGAVRVAFNNQWSWNTLVQYDNDYDEMTLNSRVRYVPEAGQEFLLVVNHGFITRDDDDLIRHPLLKSLQSDIVLKGSYLFRF